VPVQTGMTGRATLDVADGDTAPALRSGEVPVLATPRLIALCEEATCNAVGVRLAEGQTTVGMRVQFDHLAPTPVGGHVVADATLEKIEGRRLVFTVSASDGSGLVGAGRITRVVVDTETFLAKAR
jgi:predicted thioesterase